MSVAAATAYFGSPPVLYVYYNNATTSLGFMFAISAANATSTTMLIQEQNIAIGTGPSSTYKPSNAWMFPGSNNQLILLLNQSPPVIATLQPPANLAPPQAVIPYNNKTINDVQWTFSDQSQVTNLIPSGQKQLSIASGISGKSPQGSAVYEVYPSSPYPDVVKMDLSNLGGGSAASIYPAPRAATSVDPSSYSKAVGLPGTAGVNMAVVGKCLDSTQTCVAFLADSGNTFTSAAYSQAYDATSCFIATNSSKLIIMINGAGISTISYDVTGSEQQAWSSVSNVSQAGVLSCGINGSQLFAVFAGGAQPVLKTGPMSGSWALQPVTLTQPQLQSPPVPSPTGSSGDSGGPPGSGGGNNGSNGSTDANGSSSGSKTGLGKGVIIAIAIVAALLLILIPILILWWCRRKRQNDKKYEERTEELKKSIVMDQGGGKRMGSSLPLPRAIPQVPPRHSPVTFYLETPGATPALGGMTLIGHDRNSHSGSSSMPGSSTMSYDERLSVHPSHPSLPSMQSPPTMQSPLPMQSLPHPYQQPSRAWSQDGGSVANGGSPSPRTLNPSPRTLNQQHQHSFSDNESTAGPGSVDGYSDARLSRGGIYDDKHEIMGHDQDPYGHHERSTTSMSYLKSPALTELEHPRSTTTMSYMKSPALTDLEPPMPLMSPMYSPPAHYQHSSTDSAVTANSTLGAPMVQMATKPKRIRMEDMVSPGLINAQLILQQSQKPQKVSSLR